MKSASLRAGLICCAIAAFVTMAARMSVVCDDAYISFRYLDNWLAGQGLGFNPGERVEGYTNFLWIVALAPLRVIGFSPEFASALLAGLAAITIAWSVADSTRRMAGGDAVPGTVAVLLVAGSVPLAFWVGSGMETVFFAALVCIANREVVRAGFTPIAGLLFGLAILTRPDGVLFAAVAVIFYVRLDRETRRRDLAAVAGLACLPVAHMLFRWNYYGALLPNTFQAKVSGVPSLISGGLDYVGAFIAEGGLLLVVAASAALLARSSPRRPRLLLGAQVLVFVAYVVWVGGDYFPFQRFLVPIVPHLAVLGALGITGCTARMQSRRSAAALVLGCGLLAAQVVLGLASPSRLAAERLRRNLDERELVAAWIEREGLRDGLLAINAAGLIPYRTGMPTIDMLGLSDRHIASRPFRESAGAAAFVGHLKYDGAYVLDRRPDVVLTAGATLTEATSPEEAAMAAATNTFPGDREFLRLAGDTGEYAPRVAELLPDRYVVAFVRAAGEAGAAKGADDPTAATATTRTAAEWFAAGVEHMKWARLEKAAAAFRESLALNPGHPVAMTNLAFCLSDLGRHAEAIPLFEAVLARQPRQFDALFGLAQACEAAGRRERAIKLWGRYIQSAPASPWVAVARERLDALERR